MCTPNSVCESICLCIGYNLQYGLKHQEMEIDIEDDHDLYHSINQQITGEQEQQQFPGARL